MTLEPADRRREHVREAITEHGHVLEPIEEWKNDGGLRRDARDRVIQAVGLHGDDEEVD